MGLNEPMKSENIKKVQCKNSTCKQPIKIKKLAMLVLLVKEFMMAQFSKALEIKFNQTILLCFFFLKSQVARIFAISC